MPRAARLKFPLNLSKIRKDPQLKLRVLRYAGGGGLPRTEQQPAGLIACGLWTAALFSSTPSYRKKGTSLSWCLLLAEMVGFEPTCPIKDKTISSRSRYDHFDTSPYSNHAVERSANIHTDNPTALLLYQKSRLPSTGFHCRKRGRTQHQHARTIGIGQPVAADLPHKFPPVVEIFAKYYYFKAILYKRLPGLL